MPNLLSTYLADDAPLILDGGLATTLEDLGHDLDDPLWSARLLLDAPEAIAAAHRAFLEAGADVIIAASYQASLAGFAARGWSEDEAIMLLRRAVDLAVRARDAFWADPAVRTGRPRPLVAASIGPYGAFLADGSEYRGRYGLTADELRAFHEPRWQILADTPADVLACETVPSREETDVLLALIAATPGRDAWFSWCCADGRHLGDGTPLVEVARAADAVDGVAAVGVNCTAPRHVASLLDEARRGTGKPLLCYPNRGERYDAVLKEWEEGPDAGPWDADLAAWLDRGVRAVGGCCRVGPDDIVRLRQRVGELAGD